MGPDLQTMGTGSLKLSRPGQVGRWTCLAVVVAALVSSHSGRAIAQQAAAEEASNPLPIIVYPIRRQDPEPAAQKPPEPPPPPPAQIVEAPAQEPVQYYLVGGVWGFWDRDHHFHQRPVSIDRGAAGSRSNQIGIRPEDGVRHNDFPRVETHGQSPPPHTIGLSNPPPHAIVGQSPMQRDRSLTR